MRGGLLDMLSGPGAAPPPPPGPDEILASLTARDGTTQMVPATLSLDSQHYVDSSGNLLIGAPDENGMAAQGYEADGSLMGPQFFGFGPNYGDVGGLYTGGAPLAPDIWMGEGADLTVRGGGPPSPGGAPPGSLNYSGGNGIPDNWKNFDNNNITTGGGFFTMDERFGEKLPFSFQAGSSMPSTNNWRLLPPNYRRPGFIMRNGQIINTNSPTMYGPLGSGSLGDEGTAPGWRSGAAAGYPSAYSPGGTGYAVWGWPGQVGTLGGAPASS
jgi:hypothetical protein